MLACLGRGGVGNFAYVADTTGLQVIDVSDPPIACAWVASTLAVKPAA